MKILGVDPGMEGALTYYDGTELICWRMPIHEKETGGNELDIHGLVAIVREAAPEHAVLEKTSAIPGISGKAYYSMGKSEGAMVAIFAALNLPYTLVRPAQWKADMNCPKDKNLARQRASQLLPQWAHNWSKKKDDGIAESALIALWGENILK